MEFRRKIMRKLKSEKREDKSRKAKTKMSGFSVMARQIQSKKNYSRSKVKVKVKIK